MAAWRSLTDDDIDARNQRLEDYGQHVSVDDGWYETWCGPDAAGPVLLRGVERVITNLEEAA